MNSSKLWSDSQLFLLPYAEMSSGIPAEHDGPGPVPQTLAGGLMALNYKQLARKTFQLPA